MKSKLRKLEELFSFFSSALREKCPNTEFFLVGIFLYSDWMQENTDQNEFHFGHLSRCADSVKCVNKCG